MRKELIDLKKDLAKKGVYKAVIGIDELPKFEGYCIHDAINYLEIFYYERGQKMGVEYFEDINTAVSFFKNMVLADPSARR
jgi:hypothetical protein